MQRPWTSGDGAVVRREPGSSRKQASPGWRAEAGVPAAQFFPGPGAAPPARASAFHDAAAMHTGREWAEQAECTGRCPSAEAPGAATHPGCLPRSGTAWCLGLQGQNLAMGI